MADSVKSKVSSRRQEVPRATAESGARQIEPVPISLMYRCGIILVSGVMLLLPVVYLVLLVLLGHTIYWNAMYWQGNG